MVRPVFLFIGGIYHTPKHFEPIRVALASAGYESQVFELPQICLRPVASPAREDIKQLRELLAHLIEVQHRNVALVAHSYGGFVGSEAIHGLEKSARRRKNLSGGVCQAYFIAAFVIKRGESLGAVFGGKPPAYAQVDESGTHAAECARQMFFSDMDAADRQHWFEELRPMAGRSLNLISETPCWDLDMPKVYVHTTEDVVMDYATQRSLLAGAQHSQWTVVEIDSGHEPFLSRTGELAAILTRHLPA